VSSGSKFVGELGQLPEPDGALPLGSAGVEIGVVWGIAPAGGPLAAVFARMRARVANPVSTSTSPAAPAAQPSGPKTHPPRAISPVRPLGSLKLVGLLNA